MGVLQSLLNGSTPWNYHWEWNVSDSTNIFALFELHNSDAGLAFTFPQSFHWLPFRKITACLQIFANLFVFLTSLLYRGEILRHNTLRGFYKSTLKCLYWQLESTGIQTLQRLFQDILCFACYQGQRLKSCTIFSLQAACSLLPAELCCSWHPWSFTTASHLWSKHYLDISHLTN